jgi:hypothetical protein
MLGVTSFFNNKMQFIVLKSDVFARSLIKHNRPTLISLNGLCKRYVAKKIWNKENIEL